MKLVPVDSPDDQRLLPYRGTGDGELLRRHGVFVAEGRLVVQRVLEDRQLRVASLMLTETAASALGPSLQNLGPDTEVYVCGLPLFQAVTGFNIHRGCLALVERPRPVAWQHVVQPAGVPSLVVVLEDVTDADNVGSVFRNAAAFGANAVLLSPACCDPLYRKAIRTSMAATLRVPFARLESWPDALDDLRSEGFTIAALTPREPAQHLARFSATAHPLRVALLAGSEGPGLTEAALDRADCRVRIPITSAVDSLNLGVATGIALACLAGRIDTED